MVSFFGCIACAIIRVPLTPAPRDFMPGYRHIVLVKTLSDHIARLTLNSPDRRNAINNDTIDELGDTLEDIEADDSIRVVIQNDALQGPGF